MKDEIFTYDALDDNAPRIVFSGVKNSNKHRPKL
jgi:hypothetical protein